jgi:hypothetical protein
LQLKNPEDMGGLDQQRGSKPKGSENLDQRKHAAKGLDYEEPENSPVQRFVVHKPRVLGYELAKHKRTLIMKHAVRNKACDNSRR